MKTTRRGVIRSGIGAMGAVLLGNTEAKAQEAGAKASTPPENPRSLAEALAHLDWEPETRGTLLLVAPERAGLQNTAIAVDNAGQEQMYQRAGTEPVRAGRNGFNLSRIASRYRRKIAAVGSLSVVVPETMATLRYKNLPAPDLFANVRPESRPQFLLATLSPAQWRTVMSADGLGIGDLKRDQQALFAALFPETMQVFRRDPPAPGAEYGKTERVPDESINRADLRLRLYKDVSWSYLYKNKDNIGGYNDLTMGDDGGGGKTPVYTMQFPQAVDARHSFTGGEYYGGDEPAAFGVTLMEAEPNRAKPSDLDYDAAVLDRVVTLIGAKTVADLVARVRESTGIELYADGRYAALSVFFRAVPNTGVRAGILLKALALSVTGTYRRVASGTDGAFVLTDDRVGSGVRLAAISDWINAAKQGIADERKKLMNAARENDTGTNAPWAIQDDMAPSPALLKRMKEAGVGDDRETRDKKLIPLADLPPGVQDRVRYQQGQWESIIESDSDSIYKTLRKDGVILRPQAKLAVVIPGVGTVPLQGDLAFSELPYQSTSTGDNGWYALGMFPPDPKATLPVRLDTKRVVKRVLAVTVQSEDDARTAAGLAKSRGFTVLMLATETTDVTPLTTAAKTAAPGIAVWLRTPLLRQSVDAGTENLLDRTIRGETYRQSLRRPIQASPYGGFGVMPKGNAQSDYLAVGDPAALAEIRNRLNALVASPQADALVFTDMTPPGYYGKDSGVGDAMVIQEFGYTPAMRLAFLREAGTDPVDLSPVGNLESWEYERGFDQKSTRVSLPFFPDLGANADRITINNVKGTDLGAKDAYGRWYEFRAKRLAAALDTLREGMRAMNPKMPLYWGGESVYSGLGEWLPAPPVKSSTAKTTATPPKKDAPPAFVWLTYAYDRRTPLDAAPMKPGERFARQASRHLEWLNQPPKKPGEKDTRPAQAGLFLDLTQAPLAEVEGLLSQVVFAP
ncbi:MAG: hypothetical protein H7Y38_07490 [Armatimonadetes bacterium]|nr:hypothetical protein [Armatimonadota bacterium]